VIGTLCIFWPPLAAGKGSWSDCAGAEASICDSLTPTPIPVPCLHCDRASIVAAIVYEGNTAGANKAPDAIYGTCRETCGRRIRGETEYGHTDREVLAITTCVCIFPSYLVPRLLLR